jgi:hypothetical protein
VVTVTDARGLAYDFAKKRGGRWFTANDLAEGAYLDQAAAQAAAGWLADMRLLDFNYQVRPRSFRLNANAQQLVPELVREIENALEIILQRRKAEAKARAAFFGSNSSNYSHTPGPPNRRARHRNGPLPDDPLNPKPAPAGPLGGPSAPGGGYNANAAPSGSAPAPSSPPDGTRSNVRPKVGKADQLFALLARPQGASMEELVEEFGIQPHSIRAMISVKSRERGLRATLNDGRYQIHPLH